MEIPGWGKKTLVMGVLNLTPDSFSDGGQLATTEAAVQRGRKMLADGADILDIGGESTRPATFSDGAPLTVVEELHRVLPTLEALSRDLSSPVLSIDTYKAEVAEAALDAGASIINDISGLTFDPAMASLAAGRGCPIVVMHMLGLPHSVPRQPRYDDVIGDIREFFERQIMYANAQGVHDRQIWLDPGIGFGKTMQHSLEILHRLPELKALGYPLLVGPSRKRFLGHILGTDDPGDRIEGTAAAVALSIAGGADIVRVHDVYEMARVAKVSDAIMRAGTAT